MVVKTHERPRQAGAARASMEMLLVNHPLDCPICDQAGECQLQEYSLRVRPGRGARPDREDAPPEERAVRREGRLRRASAASSARAACASADEVAADARALDGRAQRPGDRDHDGEGRVRHALRDEHHRPLPGGRADLARLPLQEPALVHGLHADSLCTGCARGCNVMVGRARRPDPAHGAAREPGRQPLVDVRRGPPRLRVRERARRASTTPRVQGQGRRLARRDARRGAITAAAARAARREGRRARGRAAARSRRCGCSQGRWPRRCGGKARFAARRRRPTATAS